MARVVLSGRKTTITVMSRKAAQDAQHIRPDLKADGLRQQKTTSGSSHFSQEQESEATFGTAD